MGIIELKSLKHQNPLTHSFDVTDVTDVTDVMDLEPITSVTPTKYHRGTVFMDCRPLNVDIIGGTQNQQSQRLQRLYQL